MYDEHSEEKAGRQRKSSYWPMMIVVRLAIVMMAELILA